MSALVRRSPSRGDATREALISTAIEIFARDGFHAASTRAIAKAACVQQALIGYHFRDKDGLYLSVIAHIAGCIRDMLTPAIEQAEAALALACDDEGMRARRAHFLPPLLRVLDDMVSLMARDDLAAWSQLILREQQSPTPAFDLFYDGFMGRVVDLLGDLVLRLRGADDRNGARLMAITILGQVLVFRSGRAGVLRHMGWSRIGEGERAAIRDQINRNVAAQLGVSD